jgi:hypothetical protein
VADGLYEALHVNVTTRQGVLLPVRTFMAIVITNEDHSRPSVIYKRVMQVSVVANLKNKHFVVQKKRSA